MRLQGVQILAALAGTLLTAGCAYTPGFSFPIEEGNINDGRQAFLDHRCHQCHSIAGLTLPELAGASPPVLMLGGEIIAAKNYAELMTSIINPTHVISERYREQLQLDTLVPGESPMPTPQLDTMSVRQLINIVAFLDSRYMLIDDYESDN